MRAAPGGSASPEVNRLASLRALLQGHVPLDARERSFVERMVALAAAPCPFERESFEPGHFTASAFVLSPERDALLLIFHRKLGIWVQPGGHVEPGDVSVEAAARREVLEEVGLSELTRAHDGALFDVDIHPIPARPSEPAHEHFDVRFLYVARSRGARETDEIAGLAWVPLAEMDGFSTDESVRRAVRKLR
jgi:8-oxo-dGTP pyrophosphatase MutT (NUDIX family)